MFENLEPAGAAVVTGSFVPELPVGLEVFGAPMLTSSESTAL
jgi:hypothetical protein